MPFMYFLKNKTAMYPRLHIGDETIDNWAFYFFQMVIEELNQEGKDAVNSINPQTTGQALAGL